VNVLVIGWKGVDVMVGVVVIVDVCVVEGVIESVPVNDVGVTLADTIGEPVTVSVREAVGVGVDSFLSGARLRAINPTQ
jgi:hypothetical protein